MVPSPAADPERPRILVVEDEPLVRAGIADGLREAGFTVLEAASAEGALSYFSVGLQVDAVFTDVHLSGALDGLYLARQVSRRTGEHPRRPATLALLGSPRSGTPSWFTRPSPGASGNG